MTRKTLDFGKMIVTWAIAQVMLGEFVLASPGNIRRLPSSPKIDAPNPVNTPPNQERSRSRRIDFSDIGRPRKRQGGGSRGSCLTNNKPPLTALIPNTGLGLTTAKSPTLWFYIPYTLTPDYAVEFVLKDSRENTIYKNKVADKGTPAGIVSVRLPSTVSLKADQNYDWYFLVHCDTQKQSRFVYVNGSVRRVERRDLDKQLASLSSYDYVTRYQAEGLWYDALTKMAEIVSSSPQDAKTRQSWKKLLKSLGLEQIATEPFVPCCSFEN